MIRRGAILLALCLSPTAAAAQDRPPERPEDTAADPAGAPAPAEEPQAEPVAVPVPEPVVESSPMFGPPPPPVWWLLREDDGDFASCLRTLSARGAVFSEQPPITDPDDRDCGIARPIRVERILPGLALEGGAVMRCDTALALEGWARAFLQPAAAMLPGRPRVTALRLGTTYDCRPRVGTGEDRPKLSEHALGNAIDIAGFVLDKGEALAVQPRLDTGDMAEAFQRTARAAGCLFFTTVLGPGSNDAHDDHLHLDIAARQGGWRLCQ
ncbi:extensin family protein [Paracoccus fontiphilus]|uniref:Extensin family protein n=1 Tax=Paracoccus fontiphilus TaxID=1815556 RepID=A0ABV7IBV6_9RHOB|nr:extensin family protein [Paracoccus fontiphilus]